MKTKALAVPKLGKFRGAGFGGSKTSSASPHEDSDTLQSSQHAVVVDLLSEGQIGGICDSNWNPIHGNLAAGIWFNQSPLANNPSSWTDNFNGVTWNFNSGWVGQGPLPNTIGAQDTISVGITLKSQVPYIFSIDDPATTRVAVTIRIPELLYQDNSGNIYQYSVNFMLQISMNGSGFWELGSYEIFGKCTSDYDRTYIITLPKSANPDNDFWQIYVMRESPDDQDTKHVSTIVLDYYTRIVDAPLIYPHSAVITVGIDASQLSDIPVRAYRIQGLYILVPNNYFPATRKYTRNPYTGTDTGVYQPWNGGWYYAVSNNPAWCFMDMCVNARYGAGEYLGQNVDKWSLYAIAQYCDQYVPDGFGGWEPRFTCNTYIQAQEQAFKVLSDLASVFRGMLYWGQGQVVPVADMPKPILHNFTNANVVDGRFTYADSELKNRFSDTEVTYNDPKDFFSTKIQSCFDTDMRVRYGYRDSKFTSYGCTSRGQAHRHGTYVIVTNKYETETVTFQTGFEAMYLRPGDIIGIVDNFRIGLRQGGRVKSFGLDGHTVTLDAAIGPFHNGQEIFFYLAQDSPTIGDSFPDSNAAAGVRPPDYWKGWIFAMGGKASNTIYVSAQQGVNQPFPSSFSSVTAAVYVIGANINDPLMVPVAQYRVLTISERAQNLYEIAATTYEPDKFNLIDFGIQFTTPTFTRIQSLTYVLQPNNLTATLQAVNTNNVIVVSILLAWEQPPDDNIASYQVWMQPPNGGWSYVTQTTSTSLLISAVHGTPLIPGLYNFRVNSVNTAGITSVPARVSITVPDTSLIVPHRMSGLEIQGQGSNYTYYTESPTLAWRLNSPSKSFEFNSEAPYGASVGKYDPYFVNFAIRVYDGNTGALGWKDHTTDLQYTIDHKKNVAAWGDGNARQYLRVTVQDIDSYGLDYAPAEIFITNPPPPPVTNLVAYVQAGPAGPKTIGLEWINPMTQTLSPPFPPLSVQSQDVVSVNIYMNTSNAMPSSPVLNTNKWTQNANSNVFNRVFPSGAYWFFVTLVDSFGSESTPVGLTSSVTVS